MSMLTLTLTDISTVPVKDLVACASEQPILDASDLARLADSVDSDVRARSALARSQLRMAVDEAIRNRGLGTSQERLVRVAATAVIEAANEYDPARDGGFRRYALLRVRRALDRAMTS
jgi:DNA-directed RNA polymerase sigma subunit (sigma70/sigma32)